MTRYFLTRVQIEGFRGINNSTDPLDLKFKSNAVNSVFGPNGLGKSSIFDALSYAIRGCIPKLDGLPHSEDASAYYCNRFHTTGIATILLTLEPDDGTPNIDIRVIRDSAGTRTVDSPSGHPNPNALLKSLASDFVLLDQNTFLQFVEESPLQRGRTFSGLLGLAKLSEVRQVLQTLSNARTLKGDFEIAVLESQITNARQQRDAALQRIRVAFKSLTGIDVPEPIDPEATMTSAEAALASVELIKPHLDATGLAKLDFKTVRTTVQSAEKSDLRDELALLVRSLSTLESFKAKGDEKADQTTLRVLLEQRDSALAKTRGPLLPPVYQSTLRVLESDSWDDEKLCPACEAVSKAPLAPEIRERQTHYQTVTEFQKEIAAQWKVMAWSKRLKDTEVSAELSVADESKTFSTYDAVFRDGTASCEQLDNAVARLTALDTLIEARVTTLKNRKDEIEKLLPPSLVTLTQQIQHAEELVTQLRQYCTSQQRLDTLEAKQKRRNSWITFIEAASRTFSEAEVALSTHQATTIETQYRQMYAEITNNPAVVPRLQRAAGTEDLHLRLEKFYGLSDVSATTLLQESYRNALAISIFLSTALRSTASGRFIVLDDVTSSFDAGHQFALMELLRNKVGRPGNPGGPQIILLSHDGLLEKYFDKLSGTTSWHHQKLQGLPPQGTILCQSQNADRLRLSAETFLNAGQTAPAEPLMRQYLEYTLLQIIRKVGISVPLDFSIRDDRKMVENAVNAIMDAVKLHQSAGSLILDASQVSNLQSVIVPGLIGNWVTHYATGVTSSLSPHVLLSVLTTVDDFADCFRYDCSCSGTVSRRYYKTLSRKDCTC